MPSTAADAKGLMTTAIRDDNPVVYLHHYLLTLEHGDVPDGEYAVPFGEAEIRRAGGRRDDRRRRRGWSTGRSRRPSSWPARASRPRSSTRARSPRWTSTRSSRRSAKTGHLVLADQAPRHASVSAIIAGDVVEHGFDTLKAPIVQVTALDATVPYSEVLEQAVIPDAARIVGAVQKLLGTRAPA